MLDLKPIVHVTHNAATCTTSYVICQFPPSPHSAAPSTYNGYPVATVSVFRARSSDRQQYQLATEA